MGSTTTTLATEKCVRRALHIVRTDFLDGNEVLVGFSDGTGAIYEAEELEKLRPMPKQVLRDYRDALRQPAAPLDDRRCA